MGCLQTFGVFRFTQFAYSTYPAEPWTLFWIFVVKWKLSFLLSAQLESLRFTRAAKKSAVSVAVHIKMKDGCPYSNWNLKSGDCRKEGNNPVGLCLPWLWVLWIRNYKFCICLPYALAGWIWKRPHMYFCTFCIWMEDIKIFY